MSLGSVLRFGMGAQVIPVQRVIIHPDFNSTNMDHDVALLELSLPASMSYTIQSICLPSPVHHFLETAECYISGWGSMMEGGERPEVPTDPAFHYSIMINLLQQAGQLEMNIMWSI